MAREQIEGFGEINNKVNLFACETSIAAGG